MLIFSPKGYHFITILLLFSLSSCQNSNTPASKKSLNWVRDAKFYEVPLDALHPKQPLVYLQKKLLPHISSLGATAIVLPPVMEHLALEKDSSGVWRYPVCAPKNLQPAYGTMDSIRHFAKSVHHGGLKLVLEFPVAYKGHCTDKSTGSTMLSTHSQLRDFSSEKEGSELLETLEFWADKSDNDGFVLQGWNRVPEQVRKKIYTALHQRGIAVIADSEGEEYPRPIDADGYLNYALYDSFKAIYHKQKTANILESFILDTSATPVAIAFSSTLAINMKDGTYHKIFRLGANNITSFALHTQRASWMLGGQEIPTHSAYFPGKTVAYNWYRGALVQDYRRIWTAPATNPALLPHSNSSLRIIDLRNPEAIAFEKKWRGYRWIGIFNFSDSTNILKPTENITNINAFPNEVSVSITKRDSFRIMKWQNILLTKH